jgi:hypothetical protein
MFIFQYILLSILATLCARQHIANAGSKIGSIFLTIMVFCLWPVFLLFSLWVSFLDSAFEGDAFFKEIRK